MPVYCGIHGENVAATLNRRRAQGMANETLWFIFHGDKTLLLSGKIGVEALAYGAAAPLPPSGGGHFIGVYQGKPCVAYTVDRMPEGDAWTPISLRESYGVLGEALYGLAGKGSELIHWNASSRWCPACGVPTVPHTETSKRCPQCGKEMFPQITTAVLVLVRKDDATLLVRARNFKGPFYGLVAGFLEVGETLEECAAREVREETGLSIDNIAYFGSQPWPYPSGLMVGFVADWRRGELQMDARELLEADFYTRDILPELPPKLSLTRRMIDWWSGADPAVLPGLLGPTGKLFTG